MDPEWWLEVVHIHIEYGQCDIVLSAKLVFSFREAIPKLRTILIEKYWFLWAICCSHCDVHAGGYATENTEIGIDVRFDGCITEVDLREMAVFFLRQIEGELIVDREIVVAGSLAWVPMVVIGGVAFFAMITG